MRVLTAAEMQEVDRRAIEERGVPGMVLMENAAIGIADALGRSFPEASTVAILCGPGNNGGDGLALARHLEARGYRYRVFLITRGGRPKGDAGSQLAILEKAEIEVERVTPDSDLAPVLAACRAADVVVDALFGTGLTRALEGHFAELIAGLTPLEEHLLAVDLPSGLDGSRPTPPGPHLRARLSVTFAAPKVAHLMPPAAEAIGELVVTDLGIPGSWVDEAPGDLHLSTGAELSLRLPERNADDHKGTLGHALVVAGGAGTSGAALLATRAAVRGGAGLVTVAVPEPWRAIVEEGSFESMTLALAADSDGWLAEEAAHQVLKAAAGKAVVALGPGLGTRDGARSAVRRLVRELDRPLVLDADGLNALVGDPAGGVEAGGVEAVAERSAATILTPHPGEAGRLLGCSAAEVQADRLAAVRTLAKRSGGVVVLKGHRTLVAEHGEGVWINPTGSPALATGGSGDVLTGLLAALLAQGVEPLLAARLGVFLHGLAGELASPEGAPESLAAGDLVDHLGATLARLRAW